MGVSTLQDKDCMLVYIGDDLKEFMTVSTYASLYKIDAEYVREELRKNHMMKHEGRLLKPGIFFK
jgi:hypothetical protein